MSKLTDYWVVADRGFCSIVEKGLKKSMYGHMPDLLEKRVLGGFEPAMQWLDERHKLGGLCPGCFTPMPEPRQGKLALSPPGSVSCDPCRQCGVEP